MPIDEQAFAALMLAAGFAKAEAAAWWAVEHPWGEQRLLVDEAKDLREVGLVGPKATEWFVERDRSEGCPRVRAVGVDGLAGGRAASRDAAVIRSSPVSVAVGAG